MTSGSTDRQIEQQITNLPEYASNPPGPFPGSADALADYYPAAPSTMARLTLG
jgi:hypothetical protein